MSPGLRRRIDALKALELDYIGNDSFAPATTDEPVSGLLAAVESDSDPAPKGTTAAGSTASTTASTIGRLCDTALLSPEEERDLFRRMNLLRHRAAVGVRRLSPSRGAASSVRAIEDRLARSERLRNYLIQANTRLVVSIVRKFADNHNRFDDLLSLGLASLMRAVEKFDYSRGYRFSTYATCAVRRDLYRAVMARKKDAQRFATGADEVLAGSPGAEPDAEALDESGWKRLEGALDEMLKRLDDRERFIVTNRFGLEGGAKRASYSRLGDRLGISKERVRQLANRAMEKLRDWAPEFQLEALVS